MLKKVFADNHLKVKELSMCIQAGESRYKFAVNNKSDLLTLFNWNWPQEIDQMKIEISKPRSLPDSIALVVGYIPMDLSTNLAKKEVMKSN